MGASALTAWVAAILEAAGLGQEHAAAMAETLVEADMTGVPSHGVMLLAGYVTGLRNGGLNRDPQMRVAEDQGAVAVLDADDAPGHLSARRAADEAVARARQHGVGIVLVRNENHFGAGGPYAARIAEAGMIGLVAANAEPRVLAPGGRRPVLGTNPIAFAAPRAQDGPIVVDMATSAGSLAKIRLAQARGERVPPGWAADAAGEPTVDPLAAMAGALLPLGGGKGFGLALMVEILAGVLSGSRIGPQIPVNTPERRASQRTGAFFLALRVDGLLSESDYEERIERLVGFVHASGGAEGAPPRVPGERRARTRAEYLADGVPLPPGVLDRLVELSREIGVQPPSGLSPST